MDHSEREQCTFCPAKSNARCPSCKSASTAFSGNESVVGKNHPFFSSNPRRYPPLAPRFLQDPRYYAITVASSAALDFSRIVRPSRFFLLEALFPNSARIRTTHRRSAGYVHGYVVVVMVVVFIILFVWKGGTCSPSSGTRSREERTEKKRRRQPARLILARSVPPRACFNISRACVRVSFLLFIAERESTSASIFGEKRFQACKDEKRKPLREKTRI